MDTISVLRMDFTMLFLKLDASPSSYDYPVERKGLDGSLLRMASGRTLCSEQGS